MATPFVRKQERHPPIVKCDFMAGVTDRDGASEDAGN